MIPKGREALSAAQIKRSDKLVYGHETVGKKYRLLSTEPAVEHVLGHELADRRAPPGGIVGLLEIVRRDRNIGTDHDVGDAGTRVTLP